MSVDTADAEVELTIDSIAAGGDGVGRSDGIVVFVPRTAPGDRVRVRLDRRKRFGRGTLTSIVTPGSGRVTPECAHYLADTCGGCQLQHLGYGRQVEVKRRIIQDALARIGKRPIALLPTVQPSVLEWRYRSKLTLAMRRREGTWTIGLHRLHEPDTVFQLDDCHITDKRVMGVWKDIMAAAHLLPEALELRGSVQLTVGSEAPTAVITGGIDWPHKEELFRSVAWLRALWWKPDNRPRELVAERGSSAEGASFRQVNDAVAARLFTYVVEKVATYRPTTVIDAYSGRGANAVALAHDGVRVTAIEADRDAAAACARSLPEGSRSLTGRVEDLLDRSLPADVVILNPPRVGVHERVTSALNQTAHAPRAILYVSCDPATLGRDLARMPGYEMRSLLGFDMFPQTAHVETVCELVPRATVDPGGVA